MPKFCNRATFPDPARTAAREAIPWRILGNTWTLTGTKQQAITFWIARIYHVGEVGWVVQDRLGLIGTFCTTWLQRRAGRHNRSDSWHSARKDTLNWIRNRLRLWTAAWVDYTERVLINNANLPEKKSVAAQHILCNVLGKCDFLQYLLAKKKTRKVLLILKKSSSTLPDAHPT